MSIELRKILVAIDFGDMTDQVVTYAADMAKLFSAELVVCYVVDDAGILSRLPPGGEGYFPPNLAQVQEDYARNEMARMSALQSLAQPARLVIGRGKPSDEILRIATAEQADLLIQGTHGRGAIAHAILGSVAERNVRSAPCPVLTVRQQDRT